VTKLPNQKHASGLVYVKLHHFSDIWNISAWLYLHFFTIRFDSFFFKLS